MNLLWDITSNQAADDKVSKTDFAEYYPAVNSAFKWSSLRPHVRSATRTHILKYIDIDTYEAIVASTDTVGPVYEVKELLKKAVAEYAIYTCLPKISTVIGDMGAMESTADNTSPISIAKLKMTQWSCIMDGDAALDQALDIMEQHIDLVPFSAWAGTSEYQDGSSTYFRSTREFCRYANIDGRRAYLALLPHIRKADKEVRRILCSEADSILATFDLSEPTALQLEMIRAIRAYVAAYGMLRGIIQTSMIYTGDSYRLVSNTETYSTKSTIIATWLTGKESLTTSLKGDLNDAHQQIVDLLEDNPETYTAYAADHADTDPPSSVLISEDHVGGVML